MNFDFEKITRTLLYFLAFFIPLFYLNNGFSIVLDKTFSLGVIAIIIFLFLIFSIIKNGTILFKNSWIYLGFSLF